MRKKINVTFIKDLVEQEVIKNPNGLVSKPLAFKLENYLRKFINTKGATAKSLNSIFSLAFIAFFLYS